MHCNGHVRVVFVREVVRVNDFRMRCGENRFEVIAKLRAVGALGGSARIVELDHDPVASDSGGLALLLAASFHHLRVAELRVGAGASAARAVGARDAAKPFDIAVVAGRDAVEGHELEVVLVRADAQVRDARERGFKRLAVGDEGVGGWDVKLQERKLSGDDQS